MSPHSNTLITVLILNSHRRLIIRGHQMMSGSHINVTPPRPGPGPLLQATDTDRPTDSPSPLTSCRRFSRLLSSAMAFSICCREPSSSPFSSSAGPTALNKPGKDAISELGP